MNVIRTIAIVSTATTFGLLGCGDLEDADIESSESALTTNYYQAWKSGSATPNCVNGSGGNYSCSWTTGVGNMVAGEGWKPGSSRTIGYNAGSWSPNGNAYLTLYGWTKNSLIEYYVVDTWGSWRPPCGNSSTGTCTNNGQPVVYKGTTNIDGADYDVFTHQQVNQPSIVGTTTFMQFFSVRRTKRSTGVNNNINFPAHKSYWATKGMNLGSTWDYQIMATEAFNSSGSCNVTTW